MPNRFTPPHLRGAVAACVLSLSAVAGCDSLNPFASNPRLPGGEGEEASLQISCVANVRGRSVTCATPSIPENGPRATIIGGQRTYVTLASSNVAVVADTFAFDVTVQNLLQEAMGTEDGVTPHPEGVRVFFASGPTVTSGAGTMEVANATSTGIFSGNNQSFFEYGAPQLGGDGRLDGLEAGNGTGETSAALRWKLRMIGQVNSFAFTVFVSTKVQPLVAVSEVMANPALVSDDVGEYIELKNRGTLSVDLTDWVVSDSSSSGAGASYTVSARTIVPGGKSVLLARGPAGSNGGLEPDLVTGSALSDINLSNTADVVRVANPAGTLVDVVRYTNGAVAARSGYARERTQFGPGTDNVDNAAHWVDGSRLYNGRDRGTPTPLSGIAPGANGGITIGVSGPGYAPAGYVMSLFTEVYDSTGTRVFPTITWESLNTAVATVDAQGYVTGVDTGSVTIRATAATGATGMYTLKVVPATAANTARYENHVDFGTPADNTPTDEVVYVRPQYTFSHSKTRRQPNWVSWNLNASHFEQITNNIPRCDCFTPDPLSPEAERALLTDYRGSGYDRGHMVQSESRTNTFQENATTFYLGNIIPQAGANNQGPWGKLENHMNSLAKAGKELYIISGGEFADSSFTLNDAGRVPIAEYTWKVALVLPNGQGLANVSSADQVDVIAVRMPNLTEKHVQSSDPRFAGSPSAAGSIFNDGWEKYVTTVDAIEAKTGYDLFDLLNNTIEAQIEARNANGVTLRATRLGFSTTTGSSANSGQPLSPQPVVQVQDQNGGAFPAGNVQVTASIASGTGTLGGTRTVTTNSSGVAAFTDLVIDGAGAHTLQFTASGLTTATSGTINVTGLVDTAPTVSSTSPLQNATGVSTTATITFTFSEPVNASGSSFTVTCGAAVPFTVTGSGTSAIQVRPTSALPASTQCTATALAAGITDADTNDTEADAMAADYALSFTTGAAAPAGAVLRITELNGSITGGRDLVELVAVQGGSVAGMKLMQDGTLTLLTFPAATVETGDLIVVHLTSTVGSGDATTNETVSKSENTAVTNYANAWDFVNTTTTQIGASRRTIRILSASNEIQDALAAATPGGTPPGSWPVSLQQIQAAGQWLPVDCGGVVCTSTTSPTAEAISVNWTGMATAASGNSLRRVAAADKNLASDWAIGASSFGAANP